MLEVALRRAALFLDVIVYAKHDPGSPREADESAGVAKEALEACPEYPKERNPPGRDCHPVMLVFQVAVTQRREGKVLQDADRLEATGAVAVMRAFASTGRMGRPFFDPADPFCQSREPGPFAYGLDLFYAQLLKVEAGMHTATARALAQRRTAFLRAFLEELRLELEESQGA